MSFYLIAVVIQLRFSDCPFVINLNVICFVFAEFKEENHGICR